MNRIVSLAMVLALAVPAFAQREFGFDNRKPSGQDYLTPAETVKRFKVAPEFEVKLFASEPQLVNPVAFTLDEKGRAWVVECFEYPSRTPPGKAPRDRIVILEDTDGDGVADKRTIFAEGKDFPVSEERKKAGLGAFDLCTGLEVGHGGVWVGAPPYLWFVENKNDKPGKFERIASGFGSQDTHETLNTFQWGPDGWLYGMQGVFTQSTVKPLDGPETRMNAAVWRLHPKTRKFEIFSEGTSNPWGLDWRNTDGQFILACCVIPHLYHMVPGGIYKRQAGTSYNPYAYGQINEICDHTFHRESGWAHAGLLALDSPHMPEKYRNSVIFGSIHGCSVKQNVLKPNGSSFTASRLDDFLVSGDKNFRPINLKWGPMGDIYLIDWHDQNPCHQAKPDSWDYERGRIYRIQLKGTETKKADDFSKKNPVDLVAELESDNPYRWRTALRLMAELVEENRDQGRQKFEETARKVSPAKAMWAAKALGLVTRDVVESFNPAEGRPSPEQVTDETLWSLRGIVESEFFNAKTVTALAALAAEVKGKAIRRELASAAVRHADKFDIAPLARALMTHKDDASDPIIPHLVWVAYEKVIAKKEGSGASAEAELKWLAQQSPDNGFVREQIVPRVMRRLVATGRPTDLDACLKFVAELTDLNSREKALEGLSTALAGQTVDAPEAWAKLEPELRKEPKLSGLVNKLAVNFRDPKAYGRAKAVLFDDKASIAEKIDAARAVAQLKHAESLPTLLLMTCKEQDEAIRVEAMRGIGQYSGTKTAEDIVSFWSIYPPAVRSEAVNVLASRKEWAKLLLAAAETKKIDRRLLTDSTITRIQAFNDGELNKLIESAWGRTRPTPGELNKLIDTMRGELAAGPASYSRGKAVFTNQCAKCHKFDGTGSDVGPPLDGAGRDIEYILTNVIDPNRVIGAPYFQRIAKTEDGRVEQGLLAAEDDLSITLKVENGVLKKIAKKDLDGPVKVLEKSMMPEGLTAGMSKQDFRDLVRYVMAHPFLTSGKLNGQTVEASVRGAIPVEAGDSVLVVRFSTAADLSTKLLLGGNAAFAVKLDNTTLGTLASGKPDPDQTGMDVKLAKGDHILAIAIKSKAGGPVFVRFLDPDRKIAVAEPAGK